MNVKAEISKVNGHLCVALVDKNGWEAGEYILPPDRDNGGGVMKWLADIAQDRGVCITNIGEAGKAARKLLLR